MHPPSPPNVIFLCNFNQDVKRPSQLEIQSTMNIKIPHAKEAQLLQVNTQKPLPNEEVI